MYSIVLISSFSHLNSSGFLKLRVRISSDKDRIMNTVILKVEQ